MMTLDDLQFKFRIGDVVRHKGAIGPNTFIHEVNFFVLVRIAYEDDQGVHRAYQVRSIRNDGECMENTKRLWENELELASDAQPEAKA